MENPKSTFVMNVVVAPYARLEDLVLELRRVADILSHLPKGVSEACGDVRVFEANRDKLTVEGAWGLVPYVGP